MFLLVLRGDVLLPFVSAPNRAYRQVTAPSIHEIAAEKRIAMRHLRRIPRLLKTPCEMRECESEKRICRPDKSTEVHRAKGLEKDSIERQKNRFSSTRQDRPNSAMLTRIIPRARCGVVLPARLSDSSSLLLYRHREQ